MEDYILFTDENDNAALGFTGCEGVSFGAPEENDTDCVLCEDSPPQSDDREEYERLIKDRFKEHFAADTQKLINRRFKKYKALEEKVRTLEAEASKYAELDRLLLEERERAVRETEERMNREFKAMRGRAHENALAPHVSRSSFDVARLTKSERALLASRAQKGEKIHL